MSSLSLKRVESNARDWIDFEDRRRARFLLPLLFFAVLPLSIRSRLNRER
jgi:hypothetical protein